MRKLAPADYRRMPWRNGGGTTTEILVEPRSAIADGRFEHRVSIADVVSDGAFSRFAGCDRHIVVIAGAGMTLDCGQRGRIDLRAFEPASFSGDWDVHGALRAGPVRDFNLIVDRERSSSSLDVRELGVVERLEVAEGETCFVYVVEGSCAAVETGETLVLDAPFELAPRGRARVIIGRVMRRPGSAR